MDPDDIINRFHRFKERYDTLHRPGATRRLKDELDLGTGPFNDQLSTEELAELNKELTERVASGE